jgi:hypothetical protein
LIDIVCKYSKSFLSKRKHSKKVSFLKGNILHPLTPHMRERRSIMSNVVARGDGNVQFRRQLSTLNNSPPSGEVPRSGVGVLEARRASLLAIDIWLTANCEVSKKLLISQLSILNSQLT